VLFIDPPYFDKNLYRYDFDDDDHERLARLLKETPPTRITRQSGSLYEGWATIRPLYKSRGIDTLAISNWWGGGVPYDQPRHHHRIAAGHGSRPRLKNLNAVFVAR